MKPFSFRICAIASLLLIVLLAGESTGSLLAQTPSDSTEEKKKARISLDYFLVNNTEHRLVATVKTRVEGYFVNVPDIIINFYRDLPSSENLLASKKTDEAGKAILTIHQGNDSILWHTYVATIENDARYEDADKETVVKSAQMTLTMQEEDSVHIAQIFVGSPDSTGAVIPVEGVEAKILVKRLFGLMPVSQENLATDAEGLIRMEFPPGIPGDENGNLNVFAQVSDHDEFGNLEVSQVISWGVPTQLGASELQKELWLSSSNSPRVLMITVTILVLGIIGVIFYIIRQLIHIKNFGTQEG